MATVKLYFEPYPENDADGLRIEESADGIGGWAAIEDVASGDIGTFPNWISSFTTSNATEVDYWFRIAWKVAGIVQNYSDPLQVGDLAPKYTTPDLLKETTRHVGLLALETLYIQELITQAYYRLQSSCGPFNETDSGFIEIAPVAMRLYVEFLNVLQNESSIGSLTGILEEKIGSYRYRRTDRAVEIMTTVGESVPPNVLALMCPYSIGEEETTELISTEVFTPTPWYDDTEEVLDKKYVVTSADPDRNALDSDSFEALKKFPSP